MEPTKEAEEAWKQVVVQLNDRTLFPQTDSWYMGAGTPGKLREQLNYIRGLHAYSKECRETLLDRKGFVVVQ